MAQPTPTSRSEFIVGGKYRLVRKIGSGSFGDIYLGINITNGKQQNAILAYFLFDYLILFLFVWWLTNGIPNIHDLNFQEKKQPSNWNPLRQGILNCFMNPSYTRYCKEGLVFRTFGGMVQRGIIMSWSWTFQAHPWRIYLTSVLGDSQ